MRLELANRRYLKGLRHSQKRVLLRRGFLSGSSFLLHYFAPSRNLLHHRHLVRRPTDSNFDSSAPTSVEFGMSLLTSFSR